MEKRLSIYSDFIYGDEEVVSELNSKLGEYGLIVTREPSDSGRECVTIKFDAYKFKKKAGRNAGAKHKNVGVRMTFDEIKAAIDAKSAQEVADELGISKSTLYRRIKEAELYGDDGVSF